MYDYAPEFITLILQHKGEQHKASVYWIQGDSNPALNSSPYTVADDMISEAFPGTYLRSTLFSFSTGLRHQVHSYINVVN